METSPQPEKAAVIPEEGLSSRERFLRALRGEAADRVPGWMMRQAGRYLPQYHEVRRNYDFLELCKTPEAAAEVSIQPLEAVGSEAIVIFNDILLPLEHCGAQVAFDDHGPLIHNPVRKQDDLDRLEAMPVGNEEPIGQTIRLTRERVGEAVPIIGFIGAPWTLATYWIEGRVSRQFAEIGRLKAANPDLTHRILERITEVAIDYLKIQVEAGADAVQIFDTWGSILGQREFSEFSAPYMRRIIEAVRSLGAPVIVYVGGCAPYLAELSALGADCLSVDWRVELSHVREAVGGGMALQGNLDPTVLLAGPEATRRAVRELFERFPPGPGHVFNLGHGVLPGTPVGAAREAMDALREYGAY